MTSPAVEAADALTAASVRAAFGVAGSGISWQIITALEARGAPYYPAAHEAAAAIMAGAFGRQSGTLGCSIAIKGPGFANMTAGMLSNRYEQWPAISIAEAYDWTQPSIRMHKRLDHRAMVAPVVKDFAASTSTAAIARLAAIAREEAPGPVHLDFVPGDDSGGGDAVPLAGDCGWDVVRRLVEAARRPIVIAGSLATRSAWLDRLNGLALPVFTTVAAKGAVDERRSSAAGVFTGDGKSIAPEATLFADCDLVVGLGLRTAELLTPRPFPAPLVVLDVIGDPATTAGLGPAAVSARASADQFQWVLDSVGGKAWGVDRVEDVTVRMRARLLDERFLPAAIVSAIQDLGEDTTLVVDIGLFCTIAEHIWRARHWTRFVASANGRFMGTAVPMAVGQALARRADRTICVMGDGGLRPFWPEIALAIRERLPILFVLMTDGRYGSVASAASTPGLTSRAVDVPVPSWFGAAEALGCPARQVHTLSQFLDSVEGWTGAEGPLFIETPFDRDAYAAMTWDIR